MESTGDREYSKTSRHNSRRNSDTSPSLSTMDTTIGQRDRSNSLPVSQIKKVTIHQTVVARSSSAVACTENGDSLRRFPRVEFHDPSGRGSRGRAGVVKTSRGVPTWSDSSTESGNIGDQIGGRWNASTKTGGGGYTEVTDGGSERTGLKTGGSVKVEDLTGVRGYTGGQTNESGYTGATVGGSANIGFNSGGSVNVGSKDHMLWEKAVRELELVIAQKDTAIDNLSQVNRKLSGDVEWYERTLADTRGKVGTLEAALKNSTQRSQLGDKRDPAGYERTLGEYKDKVRILEVRLKQIEHEKGDHGWHERTIGDYRDKVRILEDKLRQVEEDRAGQERIQKGHQDTIRILEDKLRQVEEDRAGQERIEKGHQDSIRILEDKLRQVEEDSAGQERIEKGHQDTIRILEDKLRQAEENRNGQERMLMDNVRILEDKLRQTEENGNGQERMLMDNVRILEEKLRRVEGDRKGHDRIEKECEDTIRSSEEKLKQVEDKGKKGQGRTVMDNVRILEGKLRQVEDKGGQDRIRKEHESTIRTLEDKLRQVEEDRKGHEGTLMKVRVLEDKLRQATEDRNGQDRIQKEYEDTIRILEDKLRKVENMEGQRRIAEDREDTIRILEDKLRQAEDDRKGYERALRESRDNEGTLMGKLNKFEVDKRDHDRALTAAKEDIKLFEGKCAKVEQDTEWYRRTLEERNGKVRELEGYLKEMTKTEDSRSDMRSLELSQGAKNVLKNVELRRTKNELERKVKNLEEQLNGKRKIENPDMSKVQQNDEFIKKVTEHLSSFQSIVEKSLNEKLEMVTSLEGRLNGCLSNCNKLSDKVKSPPLNNVEENILQQSCMPELNTFEDDFTQGTINPGDDTQGIIAPEHVTHGIMNTVDAAQETVNPDDVTQGTMNSDDVTQEEVVGPTIQQQTIPNDTDTRNVNSTLERETSEYRSPRDRRPDLIPANVSSMNGGDLDPEKVDPKDYAAELNRLNEALVKERQINDEVIERFLELEETNKASQDTIGLLRAKLKRSQALKMENEALLVEIAELKGIPMLLEQSITDGTGFEGINRDIEVHEGINRNTVLQQGISDDNEVQQGTVIDAQKQAINMVAEVQQRTNEEHKRIIRDQEVQEGTNEVQVGINEVQAGIQEDTYEEQMESLRIVLESRDVQLKELREKIGEDDELIEELRANYQREEKWNRELHRKYEWELSSSATKDEQMDEFQDCLWEREKTVRQLQEQLEFEDKRCEELLEKLIASQKEGEEYEALVGNIQRKLEDKEKRITEFCEQNDRDAIVIGNLSEENVKLRGEVERSRGEVERLTKARKHLEEDVETLNSSLTMAEQSKETCTRKQEDDVSKLSEKLMKEEMTSRNKDEVIEELQETVTSLLIDVKEMEFRVEEGKLKQEEELMKVSEMVEQKERDLSEATERYREMQDVCESLRQEIYQKNEDIFEKDAEIANKRETVESREKELEELRGVCGSSTRLNGKPALVYTELEMEELNEHLQEERLTCENYRARVEVLENEVKESENGFLEIKTKFEAENETRENELKTVREELHEKENVLEKARTELQEKEHELEKTRVELHERENALEEARKELHERENALEQTRNELAKTREELHEKENALGEARKELHEKENALEQTRNELAKTREELHEKENALGEARKELHKREDTLEKTRKELNEMFEATNKSKDENDKLLGRTRDELHEKCTLLEKTREELHENSRMLEKTREKLHETNTLLENARNKGVEKDSLLEKRDLELQEIKKEASEQKETLLSKENEFMQSKTDLKGIYVKLGDMERVKEELQGTMKVNAGELKTLRDDLAKLLKTNSQLKEELKRKEAAMKRKENENSEELNVLHSICKDMDGEKDGLESTVKEHEGKLGTLRDELEKMVQANEALKVENGKMEEKGKQSETVNDEKMRELNTKLEELRKENGALQRTVKDNDDQLGTLKDEFETMAQANEALKVEIGKMEDMKRSEMANGEQMKELGHENGVLRRTVKDNENQLCTMRDNLEASLKESGKLQSEVDQCLGRISSLVTENGELKNEVEQLQEKCVESEEELQSARASNVSLKYALDEYMCRSREQAVTMATYEKEVAALKTHINEMDMLVQNIRTTMEHVRRSNGESQSEGEDLWNNGPTSTILDRIETQYDNAILSEVDGIYSVDDGPLGTPMGSMESFVMEMEESPLEQKQLENLPQGDVGSLRDSSGPEETILDTTGSVIRVVKESPMTQTELESPIENHEEGLLRDSSGPEETILDTTGSIIRVVKGTPQFEQECLIGNHVNGLEGDDTGSQGTTLNEEGSQSLDLERSLNYPQDERLTGSAVSDKFLHGNENGDVKASLGMTSDGAVTRATDHEVHGKFWNTSLLQPMRKMFKYRSVLAFVVLGFLAVIFSLGCLSNAVVSRKYLFVFANSIVSMVMFVLWREEARRNRRHQVRFRGNGEKTREIGENARENGHVPGEISCQQHCEYCGSDVAVGRDDELRHFSEIKSSFQELHEKFLDAVENCTQDTVPIQQLYNDYETLKDEVETMRQERLDNEMILEEETPEGDSSMGTELWPKLQLYIGARYKGALLNLGKILIILLLCEMVYIRATSTWPQFLRQATFVLGSLIITCVMDLLCVDLARDSRHAEYNAQEVAREIHELNEIIDREHALVLKQREAIKALERRLRREFERRIKQRNVLLKKIRYKGKLEDLRGLLGDDKDNEETKIEDKKKLTQNRENVKFLEDILSDAKKPLNLDLTFSPMFFFVSIPLTGIMLSCRYFMLAAAMMSFQVMVFLKEGKYVSGDLLPKVFQRQVSPIIMDSVVVLYACVLAVCLPQCSQGILVLVTCSLAQLSVHWWTCYRLATKEDILSEISNKFFAEKRT